MKYLRADEYALTEVKQDEAFNVKNFSDAQLTCTNQANRLFLVTLVYKDLAQAIRAHDMTRLKTLVDIKLNLYGVSLKDLPFRFRWPSTQLTTNTTDDVTVAGEKYTPPLELAAATRNFLAFSYLLEAIYNSFNAAKTNATILRPIEKNLGLLHSYDLQTISEFNEYLSELREAAEENEIYELVDILDNFDEDKEIAAITNDGTNTDFNKVYWESLSLGNFNNVKSGKQGLITTTTTTMAVATAAASNGTSVANRLKANLTMYQQGVELSKYNTYYNSNNRKNSSTDLDIYNSRQLNSKLCAIL